MYSETGYVKEAHPGKSNAKNAAGAPLNDKKK
jgi:hypothetical protein